MTILHTRAAAALAAGPDVCDLLRTRTERRRAQTEGRTQSRRAWLQRELHATSCFTSAQGDPGPEVLISEHPRGRFSEGLV